MTKKTMPDELWVFDSPRSIGDLGFTQTKKEEGFIKYTRADKPAQLPQLTANCRHLDRALDMAIETIMYCVSNNPISDQTSRRVEAAFNEIRRIRTEIIRNQRNE